MGVLHRVIVASIFVTMGVYVIQCSEKTETYIQERYQKNIENLNDLFGKKIVDNLKEEIDKLMDFKVSMANYFIGFLFIFTALCILFHIRSVVFIMSMLYLIFGLLLYYPYNGWRTLAIEKLRILLFVAALFFNMLLIIGESKKGKYRDNSLVRRGHKDRSKAYNPESKQYNKSSEQRMWGRTSKKSRRKDAQMGWA